MMEEGRIRSLCIFGYGLGVSEKNSWVIYLCIVLRWSRIIEHFRTINRSLGSDHGFGSHSY